MAKKEELRLPMENVKTQYEEPEEALASPVACSADEHLRRVFGEIGVPPAPHPKFAQYIHGWNTYIIDAKVSSG
eukprot:Skav200579  [mRNA]  locus=scaffold917:315359:317047:- [translate_table: standard]